MHPAKRRPRPDALALDRAMIPFELAVRLRVIRRSPDVRHTADANERLEILSDKLWAVVADDPRRLAGKLLAGSLEDCLDVLFGHALADFPMYDEPTVPVQDAAHVIKRAAQVQVGDVDVPVTMRPAGLLKTFALARRLHVVAIENARALEYAGVRACRSIAGNTAKS